VPQKYPGKKYYQGAKIGQYSCNPLGKNPGDVWVIPNVKHNHTEKTVHPCQFPVELIERLVLAFTKENDLVVDPYLGVGSAACKSTLSKPLNRTHLRFDSLTDSKGRNADTPSLFAPERA
jgi:adenine-specific DNA-methyltransferase